MQGQGVTGVVDGHAVVAGRESLLADWSMALDDELAAAKAAAEADKRTKGKYSDKIAKGRVKAHEQLAKMDDKNDGRGPGGGAGGPGGPTGPAGPRR